MCACLFLTLNSFQCVVTIWHVDYRNDNGLWLKVGKNTDQYYWLQLCKEGAEVHIRVLHLNATIHLHLDVMHDFVSNWLFSVSPDLWLLFMREERLMLHYLGQTTECATACLCSHISNCYLHWLLIFSEALFRIVCVLCSITPYIILPMYCPFCSFLSCSLVQKCCSWTSSTTTVKLWRQCCWIWFRTSRVSEMLQQILSSPKQFLKPIKFSFCHQYHACTHFVAPCEGKLSFHIRWWLLWMKTWQLCIIFPLSIEDQIY